MFTFGSTFKFVIRNGILVKALKAGVQVEKPEILQSLMWSKEFKNKKIKISWLNKLFYCTSNLSLKKLICCDHVRSLHETGFPTFVHKKGSIMDFPLFLAFFHNQVWQLFMLIFILPNLEKIIFIKDLVPQIY